MMRTTRIVGDSLILIGTEPGSLCFDGLCPESVTVRSTYEPDLPQTLVYEVGWDYEVDLAGGMISRTAHSRIPDFRNNVLYGQKGFDHTKFPQYGNASYFVYVDYDTVRACAFCPASDQSALLPHASRKLRYGGLFKIIAFGDSITYGYDTSATHLQFPHRYARHLSARFPEARIEVENGATGGHATVHGLACIEEKVLRREPDLVLVAFGMNDHNVGGVPVGQFEQNLVDMAGAIRGRTEADVMLLSACVPHPDWIFNSHRMGAYAAATRRAAQRAQCAYADVYGVWCKVLERKDPSSLLGNNINHPNDFGHWLYLQALKSVQF